VRLAFEDQGWEDYTSWLKSKPEPLKYHLPRA